ncbi:hypothetical protein SAMN04488028_101259 [Reichenbachiella agariperforans]|uniref:Uncharacterized protein n=1 Tax=Reichenbachiella agariperforans TaxID=156994 RepID=A0A1M6JNW4_REIAG|nr:hypothetical protein SAMN04488028_101259 [Reichenbachiella agariperforans]
MPDASREFSGCVRVIGVSKKLNKTLLFKLKVKNNEECSKSI